MNHHFNSPLKAYIDLKAFQNNINYIRSRCPHSPIVLPVKANAYGHDDLLISRFAQEIGIEYLAVARVDEGIRLRNHQIRLPIIDLGVELDDNMDSAIKHKIELSIHSLTYAEELEKKAGKYKIKIPVHLKVDTGMRRLGCPLEEAESIAGFISDSPYLLFKSLYSHFANSGDDFKLSQEQTDLFLTLKTRLVEKKIIPEFYHIDNSGSILKPHAAMTDFALRPGILSYGYAPIECPDRNYLKPVMTLSSKVINLKKVPAGSGISYGHTFITKEPSIIATIPLGYGDGFMRSLSNQFKVTINGKQYSQIGRISMDLSVIQVDDAVKIGDEVFIFGNRDKCINTADDLAGLAGTICYEITTMINNRVPRIPI